MDDIRDFAQKPVMTGDPCEEIRITFRWYGLNNDYEMVKNGESLCLYHLNMKL